MARFLALLPPPEHGPVRVLDIGGTVEFWARVALPDHVHVHLINRMDQPGTDRITAEIGDARYLPRFANNAFDVVFSNSCIGHVGGIDDQRRMGAEVRRLAPRYWVQTPARSFPVDWRTRVPCFHWLPRDVRVIAYRMVPVGTYRRASSWEIAERWVHSSRDMTHGEFASAFPDAQIVRERVAGITKSYIAIRWP